MSLAFMIAGCGEKQLMPVEDVSVCVDRVKAKLFENRHLLFASDQDNGPEFYVLDATFGGDLNVAISFMKMNGWTGWASSKDEDKDKLFAVPNDGGFRGDEPIGELSDGPNLACRASKISGVPFVSVMRRSEDLSTIIYEFTP